MSIYLSYFICIRQVSDSRHKCYWPHSCASVALRRSFVGSLGDALAIDCDPKPEALQLGVLRAMI